MLYKMTSDGALTRLVTFNGANGSSPFAGLVSDDNGNFYGTTLYGGRSDLGTVFKVTPGGALTTLVDFDNFKGRGPAGLAIGPDGTLYGTTVTAENYYGTIYKIATDGTFSTLIRYADNYGSFPGGLTFGVDGALYGRTYNGVTGIGTVFRATPEGALRTLASLSGCSAVYSTALTLGNDGNFYGTTIESGSANLGAAFRVTSDGIITRLLSFNSTNGALPAGPLTLGVDGNFYGTTIYGGIFEGTVFKLKPDGDLTTLANFPSRSFGVRPYNGVTFGADGSLYGTAITGGSSDEGIVFRVDLPPEILLQPVSRITGVGMTATFMVNAAGTKPLLFQWLKNGTNITDAQDILGSSSATLTLSNVGVSDSGNFSVIINNVSGTVTSSVAALSVIEIDSDGDGVPDELDQCPGTVGGSPVDGQGCSIEQLAPCTGPATGGKWKNHGEYLGAVSGAIKDFLTQRIINTQEARKIFAEAAQSGCGKR
jgi:uncharacterized repeat protein (TIGR03803 family)